MEQFPDSSNVARLALYHKDGQADGRSNYRPTSVLQAVAKLSEKLIYEQLDPYPNEDNLFFSGQSGL